MARPKSRHTTRFDEEEEARRNASAKPVKQSEQGSALTSVASITPKSSPSPAVVQDPKPTAAPGTSESSGGALTDARGLVNQARGQFGVPASNDSLTMAEMDRARAGRMSDPMSQGMSTDALNTFERIGFLNRSAEGQPARLDPSNPTIGGQSVTAQQLSGMGIQAKYDPINVDPAVRQGLGHGFPSSVSKPLLRQTADAPAKKATDEVAIEAGQSTSGKAISRAEVIKEMNRSGKTGAKGYQAAIDRLTKKNASTSPVASNPKDRLKQIAQGANSTAAIAAIKTLHDIEGDERSRAAAEGQGANAQEPMARLRQLVQSDDANVALQASKALVGNLSGAKKVPETWRKRWEALNAEIYADRRAASAVDFTGRNPTAAAVAAQAKLDPDNPKSLIAQQQAMLDELEQLEGSAKAPLTSTGTPGPVPGASSPAPTGAATATPSAPVTGDVRAPLTQPKVDQNVIVQILESRPDLRVALQSDNPQQVAAAKAQLFHLYKNANLTKP